MNCMCIRPMGSWYVFLFQFLLTGYYLYLYILNEWSHLHPIQCTNIWHFTWENGSTKVVFKFEVLELVWKSFQNSVNFCAVHLFNFSSSSLFFSYFFHSILFIFFFPHNCKIEVIIWRMVGSKKHGAWKVSNLCKNNTKKYTNYFFGMNRWSK